METELKLKIDAIDRSRIYEHPLLVDNARAVPSEHQLVDTYYDTKKLDLWRHGVTLRVREDGLSEEGSIRTQTVKTASVSSASLHQRGEWESALSSAVPQPSEIARQIKVERIRSVSMTLKHLVESARV